jgi:hypothetical protein
MSSARSNIVIAVPVLLLFVLAFSVRSLTDAVRFLAVAAFWGGLLYDHRSPGTAKREATRATVASATAPSAQDVLDRDRRPPILYLRPFDSDEARLGRSWHQRIRRRHGDPGPNARYEDWLAARLRYIGPLITVGAPMESVVKRGASRLYLGDDWQAGVSDLISAAGVIIVRVGDSPGLAWEVERIVAHSDPGRVLLGLPLARWAERKSRYASFRARFQDVFPRGLPTHVDGTTFIYFDDDWTPRLLLGADTRKPTDLFGGSDRRALVLEQLT